MTAPKHRLAEKATERFTGRGHSSILATHRSTFEVTKSPHLTRKGDCVVAVASEKGAGDLSDELTGILKQAGSSLTIILQAGEETEVVKARGSPRLTLSHYEDLVVRKSSFVCSRTLAVEANKAAADFSRAFVNKLTSPQQQVVITLIAEVTI
jgi:hypothetical protein